MGEEGGVPPKAVVTQLSSGPFIAAELRNRGWSAQAGQQAREHISQSARAIKRIFSLRARHKNADMVAVG